MAISHSSFSNESRALTGFARGNWLPGCEPGLSTAEQPQFYVGAALTLLKLL